MDTVEDLDRLRAAARVLIIETGDHRIQADGFGNLHLQRLEQTTMKAPGGTKGIKRQWVPVCGTKDTDKMLEHWKRKTRPETA